MLRSANTPVVAEELPDSYVSSLARNCLDHIFAVSTLQKVLVHVNLTFDPGVDIQQSLVLLVLLF